MGKKSQEREIKRLISPTYILKVADDSGTIDHVISVMGIIDSHEDRIDKGAYVKTIAEGFSRIKLLDNHRTNSATDIIGSPVRLAELSKAEFLKQYPEAADKMGAQFPDYTAVLVATSRYNLQTQKGREVYELVKAGDVSEYSVGIIIINPRFEEIKNGEVAPRRIRVIPEVILLEYSSVIWGANPGTMTLADIAPDNIEYHWLGSEPIYRNEENGTAGNEQSQAETEGEASDTLLADALDTPESVALAVGALDVSHNILALPVHTRDVDSARRLEKSLASIMTERVLKQLSLTQRVQIVRIQFFRQVDSRDPRDLWVIDVFEDTLTVFDAFDDLVGRVWQLGYTFDESTLQVTFAEVSTWVEGRYEFVPGEAAATASAALVEAGSVEPPTSPENDQIERRAAAMRRLKKLQWKTKAERSITR